MRQVTMIDLGEWDDLVVQTYGKPYAFQQQDGCKDRGVEEFSVPCKYPDDFEADKIPFKINGSVMGVSFKAWLEAKPTKYSEDIFWERNFYPSVGMIANDLHSKGLLPSGDYVIEIDW